MLLLIAVFIVVSYYIPELRFISLPFVISYIYVTIKRIYSYWEDKGVPFKRPNIFFGNFTKGFLLRKTVAEEYVNLCHEFRDEKFFGVYESINPAIVFHDPEIIKQVLIKDFQYFQNRGMEVDKNKDKLSQHLFVLKGDEWKTTRAKLSPTFTSGKMKLLFNLVVECADELNNFIHKNVVNECVNIKQLTADYTTDAIGSCAFGLQLNSFKNKDSEFKKMGRLIFSTKKTDYLIRIVRAISPKIIRILRLSRINKEVEDFFLRIVRDTIEYREKNEINRGDFMQLLLQLRNKGKVDDEEEKLEDNGENTLNDSETREDGKHLVDIDYSDAFLASQALLFFLAGFETSSTTLSFCLYHLSKDQNVQNKLRNEIEMVLNNHKELTYSAIQDMKYMTMVIDETLRIYPPAPTLLRVANKPYTIPGTKINLENGTRVRIPVFAIHRNPEIFPNPEEFDPERFSEENRSKIPNCAYLPFGEGPRICIGMRFAYLQMKVLLATVLRKYRFELPSNQNTSFKLNPLSLTLSAKPDIRLKISRL